MASSILDGLFSVPAVVVESVATYDRLANSILLTVLRVERTVCPMLATSI